MNKIKPRRLSQNLRAIYDPHKKQMTALDRFKTVCRPYYAPVGGLFPYIENGTSILEIGCGMGPVIFSIAGYRHIEDYLGIDTDQGALNIARKANIFDNLNFIAGTVYDIPKSRLSKFQTLIIFDVLHHIPEGDKLNFLRYLFDAAADDALIIIKDLDARPRLCAMANDLTDWLSTRSVVSYMHRHDLISELEQGGFRILDVANQYMWVWNHLTIAARKTGS